MRLLTTYALVLIFLTCLVSSAVSLGEMSSSYPPIHFSGTMNYSSTSANMVYSTSFESSTVYDANRLDLEGLGWTKPRNWWGLNTGTFWVENTASPTPGAPAPRTGNKLIGLMVPAGTGSAIRSEFELIDLDGTEENSIRLSNEAFFSTWLWLPPDWSLNRANFLNWYEIINPYVLHDDSDFYPRTCLHIERDTRTGHSGQYDLKLKYYTAIGKFTVIGRISSFVVPRGEWFNIKWWLRLSSTPANGAIKLWLTTSTYGPDYLLADYTGLQTKGSDNYWSAYVAKVYLDGDNVTKYLYADDLEVWDGLPTP